MRLTTRKPPNSVAGARMVKPPGAELKTVKAVFDLEIERNAHLLSAHGAFREIEMRNLPSPDNPKTSHLAALSAIRAVRRASGAGIVLG